jgi:hypothetical protein
VRLRATLSATEPEQECDQQDRSDDPDYHADVAQEEQQDDPDHDEYKRKGEHGRSVPGGRESKPLDA